jgi:hypothetical protein
MMNYDGGEEGGFAMHVFAPAGAGFLLAVLWFDLMFDVQTRKHAGEVLPGEVLASIFILLPARHDRCLSDESPPRSRTRCSSGAPRMRRRSNRRWRAQSFVIIFQASHA